MAQFLVQKLRVWQVLSVLAVTLALLTFVGFYVRLWWVFDIISHFRVQYFVILLLLAFLFLLGKKYRQAAFAGVFACINCLLIIPSSFGSTPNDLSKPTLRASLINLANQNHSHEKARDFINDKRADILILEEFNKVWREELRETLKQYPFSAVSPQKNGWGIGLFSRIPLLHGKAYHPWRDPEDNSPIPYLKAKVEVNGKILNLFAVHLLSPVNDPLTKLRNEQLDYIRDRMKEENGTTMVMGDLNITLWSPIFQDFIKQTQLRVLKGSLVHQPTWPTNFFPFLIPIDYFIASRDILVHGLTTGPDIGSDHYPLVVDFSIGH